MHQRNSVSLSRAGISAARNAPLAGPDPAVARWIRRTLRENPPRARSLIVTIWGDALAPHGGTVWLAGLIRLLEPFGINERLTRTSVFRLARDGWVVGHTHGRQSRYRLTDEGRARFAAAYRRIYAPPVEDWAGDWEIVVDPPGAADSAARAGLREALGWDGFGALAPGLYMRPRTDGDAAEELVHLAGGERALVLQARDAAREGTPALAAQVARLWDLDALAGDYRRFLALFGGVIERFRMRAIEASEPAQCFVVRTLLIHAFRRVLLRDPRLPPALLPLDWPGAAAYTLTRDFYRLTAAQAEKHLATTLGMDGSDWPAAEPAFHARFGGAMQADR